MGLEVGASASFRRWEEYGAQSLCFCCSPSAGHISTSKTDVVGVGEDGEKDAEVSMLPRTGDELQ
jgi:hypothetical protein